MTCMILGCERPARGDVDTVDVQAGDLVVTVPAHFCRYCEDHDCELERYLKRRVTR